MCLNNGPVSDLIARKKSVSRNRKKAWANVLIRGEWMLLIRQWLKSKQYCQMGCLLTCKYELENECSELNIQTYKWKRS